MLALGCDGPRNAADQVGKGPKPPAPRVEEDDRSLQTGSGEATRYDEATSKVLYKVRFENSRLQFDKEGVFGGSMEKVSGEWYDAQGKPTTFRGDGAVADKASRRLALRGKVEVKSAEPRASMTAAEVVWDSKRQRIEAKGNVTFENDTYTLGPTDEVWATPNLGTIASPGMFKP